jgi:serine/threonine-protein kinase
VAPLIDPYSLVGTTLRERYTIVSFCGVGRYSIVYRAIEAETQRAVALRFLKVRSNLTPSQRTVTVERLRALVQPMVEIAEHYPSLADVIEVGALVTSEGRWMPAIVQPWLNGQTLESVLVNERRTTDVKRTLARAIDLLSPVADALQYAHIRGLVHGSVAPRNIFVRGMRASRSAFDNARSEWAGVDLLDLGIAHALETLQAKDHAFAEATAPLHFFAPAHGAPEQFTLTHGEVGPATDVFALALVVVELLTGNAPLGEGDDEQLERASRDPVYRPTPRMYGMALGPYVEAVFERALAVRPDDRYATMASFWDALRVASRVLLRGSSSSILPPPLPMDLDPTDVLDVPSAPGLPDVVTMHSIVAEPPPREYARALSLRDYTSRDRSLRDSDALRTIHPPRPIIPPQEFFAPHDDEAESVSLDEVASVTNPLFGADAGRSVAPTAMDTPTLEEITAEARSGTRVVGALLALAASFVIGASTASIGVRALMPARATLTYSPLPDDVLAAVAAIRVPPPPAPLALKAADPVKAADAPIDDKTRKPAAPPPHKARDTKVRVRHY